MILIKQQGCFKKPEGCYTLKLTDCGAKGDAEAADKAEVFVVNFPAFRLYLSEFDTPSVGGETQGLADVTQSVGIKCSTRSCGMSKTS